MSGCPAGSAARHNVERLAVERLGLGGAVGRLQQAGQVVEAGGDVRMPGGQRGPANVERLAMERLGLGVAAGRLQQAARLLRLVAMSGSPAGSAARRMSSAAR